jgi:hypothetical protein
VCIFDSQCMSVMHVTDYTVLASMISVRPSVLAGTDCPVIERVLSVYGYPSEGRK